MLINLRICTGGDLCAGEPFEEKACEQVPCPSWSAWQPWSQCSVTCGQGQMHRVRLCDSGSNCVGEAEEREICSAKPCPEWTDWSSWSQCTETCGTKGTRLRTRTCLQSNLISTKCQGAAQDQIACRELPECPSWSEWASWSPCSVSCGHGQENRQRSCLPLGSKCTGADKEFRFCQESVCPYWDEWSQWSGCSVTCGIGTCERSRKCVKGDVANVASKEGFLLEGNKDGANFKYSTEGMVIPVKSANEHALELRRNELDGDDGSVSKEPHLQPYKIIAPVPDVLSVSQSSGSGTRRARDSAGCTGDSIDRKRCDAGPCCELTQWNVWTTCSVSCGGGTRQRDRSCILQGGSHSYYKPDRVPYYSDVNREQLAVETANESGFRPLGETSDVLPDGVRQDILAPISAGLQPIIPMKRFGRLRRTSRQVAAAHIYNVEPYEQDNYAPAATVDESICRCDGELHQEDSCAQQPCPNAKLAPVCGWSHWSEWCGCTGSCNQGIRVRTRYCDGGTPANDNASDGGYSPPSSEKCQCFGSTTEKGPCIPPECTRQQGPQIPIIGKSSGARPYPTRPDFRILSQHDGQLGRSVNRDTYVGCTWSTWSAWTSCMAGSKLRTRSCVGISLAKIRCHCDGNLVNQVPCSNSQRTEAMVTNRSTTTDSAILPAPAITWRGTTVPPDSLMSTAYRSDLATCQWSQWGLWSVCSVSCGTGEIIRKRICPCRSCGTGNTMEVRSCELMNCTAAGNNVYRKNPFD